MILARGNIARTKKLCYDKEKEEAFKERDEGKKNFPPLFSNDCNKGEKD